MNAIEIKNLQRIFKTHTGVIKRTAREVRAVEDVSLEIQSGELFGLLGPNGAGKTTTIKILTGLIRPTSGDALVCGHSIQTAPLEAKARIGYLPESGALFEKLTPREHLAVVGRLYNVPEPEIAPRSARWLGFFGLESRADQRIHTFSKGLKQRVCWAVALLHDPDVLVLDEPLNGLDLEMVTQVKELLRELVAAGRTVFYSSHLMDVVEKVSTRVGVLYQGRLILVDTVAGILATTGASSLESALPRLWQSPKA
jgi:ABC-2 type transport system ATP-binding protein